MSVDIAPRKTKGDKTQQLYWGRECGLLIDFFGADLLPSIWGQYLLLTFLSCCYLCLQHSQVVIFSSSYIEQGIDNWTLRTDVRCVIKRGKSRFSVSRGGHSVILSRWQWLSISRLWWTKLRKESKYYNLKFCLGSDAKRKN